MSSKERRPSSSIHSKATRSSQKQSISSNSTKGKSHQQNQNSQVLPDKIDTMKVVEMIRNADLYDLINISLRSNEFKSEHVEMFIQKALQKNSSQQSLNELANQQIDLRQLELIFTPPSKQSQRQGQEQSSPQQNDENQPMTSNNLSQKQKQQLLCYLEQSQNTQKPIQKLLQPSILVNQQIQDNQQHKSMIQGSQNQFIQHQSFCNNQQLLQDYQNQLQKRLVLDESQDFNHTLPREQVPQPYQEIPTSPTDENAPYNDQFQGIHNQSFSDSDFMKDSNKKISGRQCNQTQLQTVQEHQYRGDQFSFSLKKRESIINKSPGASNYSSSKDKFYSSNTKKTSQQPLEDLRSYEKLLKFQHSQKYQQQNHPEVANEQPMNRTLSNFRFNQHQTLGRSASNNRLDQKEQTHKSKSRNPMLSSANSTKNLLSKHKSFLHTSKDQGKEENLNKTPRANTSKAFNLMASGQHSSRNTESEIKERQSSSIQDKSEMKQIIDQKKQKMVSSMQQMNIKFLIELERIKKPSQLAYATGRLVCQFFSIFKDFSNNGKQLHMEDVLEWNDIQKHINGHIIKYSNELFQTIKQKILFHDSSNAQQRELLEFKLLQLHQEYFTGDNLKIFKHLSTNKTLQTIVTFIFNSLSYFLQIQHNERVADCVDESEEIYADSFRESKSNQVSSFLDENSNNDLTLSQRQSCQRKTALEKSSARKQRRIAFGRKDNTPTASQNQEKTTVKEKLQKSASRCLLQRRDKSQILSKEIQISNNKSPMVKNAKNISFFKKNQQDLVTDKKHVMEQNASKRIPLTQRQKSLSKSPMKDISCEDQRTKQEIKERLSQIVEQHELIDISQRLSSSRFAIDYDQDLNTEEPIDFNYQLMAESSNIQELIKSSAAAIEKNMKNSPSKKPIDMSIIEQIKQRRKEQKMREYSEERTSNSVQKRNILQD